uniref:Uncharacterized protein n=2 Tax=Caenorhabditis japonica TaxID=281687 RepID=A0A8R1DM35_CAEJA
MVIRGSGRKTVTMRSLVVTPTNASTANAAKALKKLDPANSSETEYGVFSAARQRSPTSLGKSSTIECSAPPQHHWAHTTPKRKPMRLIENESSRDRGPVIGKGSGTMRKKREVVGVESSYGSTPLRVPAAARNHAPLHVLRSHLLPSLLSPMHARPQQGRSTGQRLADLRQTANNFDCQ